MAIRISEDFTTLTVDGRVVATARFSKVAAADGNGAWIVSTHPVRLCSTATKPLRLCRSPSGSRLASATTTRFVKDWRRELFL